MPLPQIPISYTIDSHDRKKISNFFKRICYKLFSIKKFNVAFSIKCHEGLNSGAYYKQIINDYNKKIYSLKLSNLIIVKDIKDIVAFDSVEEAEKFRMQTNLDLIIWGDFTEDGLKNEGKEYYSIDLHFTYASPAPKESEEGVLIKAELLTVLAKKNYAQVLEDNSYQDIKLITKDLCDFSTYLLGFTMTFFGKLNNSISILETILKDSIDDSEFNNIIKRHLIAIYQLFHQDLYFRKKFERAKEYMLKAYNLNKEHITPLAALAAIEYKLKKYENSEYYLNELNRLYPNNALVIGDNAFMYILKRNFKKAFNEYQRLLNHRLNFNLIEVTDFLEEEFDITSEPALLYGVGFLNYYFADKKRAKIVLKKFIELISEEKYRLMFRDAKRMLRS